MFKPNNSSLTATPARTSTTSTVRPTLRLLASVGLVVSATLSSLPSASAAARAKNPVTRERVMTIINNVQAYWAQHAADGGITGAYTPVPANRIASLTDSPFLCDGEPVNLKDAKENAVAVECAEGSGVIYDLRFLGTLERDYGPSAPSVFLAHEFGHVVAYQTKIKLSDVMHEQFADCMAGSFASGALDAKQAPFDVPGSLDESVAALISIGDRPGSNVNDPEAHGLAFDRIRAFQDGFNQPGKGCTTYQATPPPLTEIPFDKRDYRNGNAPFKQARKMSEKSLKQFIAANPSLGALTPRLTTLTIPQLQKKHLAIGDGATFAMYGADTFAGGKKISDGEQLQQACQVGAWFGWIVENRKKSVFALSAGDLDEAVAMYADLTDQNAEALLFDRINAMGGGFVSGLASCTAT